MSQRARGFARDWLPPALVRRLAGSPAGALSFTDGYNSWESAASAAGGYDAPSILEQVVAATELASSGAVAFERDGITFDQPESRWPLAAALLLAASRNHGRLRVLDFGGSLGSVYWQHRRLLEHIYLSWGVVEQEDFIREGARFATGELSFWPSIDDFLREGAPDLILLSSVLQYLPEPHSILEALSVTEAPYLLIDRTPVSDEPQDTLTVQQVPEQIYQASYPAWILSEELLLSSLAAEWSLIEAFPGIEPDMETSSGVAFAWRGYFLERHPRG